MEAALDQSRDHTYRSSRSYRPNAFEYQRLNEWVEDRNVTPILVIDPTVDKAFLLMRESEIRCTEGFPKLCRMMNGKGAISVDG